MKYSEFEIVNYKTKLEMRNKLLNESNLIIYVCGTLGEVEILKHGKMRFGENLFHDEFNKIHFNNNFKTINISFDVSNRKKPAEKKRNETEMRLIESPVNLLPSSSNRAIFSLPFDNVSMIKILLKRAKLEHSTNNFYLNLVILRRLQQSLNSIIKKFIIFSLDRAFRNIIQKQIKTNKDIFLIEELVERDHYNYLFDSEIIESENL